MDATLLQSYTGLLGPIGFILPEFVAYLGKEG